MSFRVSVDVMVPTRDGTKLATDIWLPESDFRLPALLMRTPYGKGWLTTTYGITSPNIFELMKRGYAVAIQECRGTFGSEGTFVPHVADADDGADTVQWLIDQEWCDGNIGSFGPSYIGFVQLQTAATGVPGLKAIAPAATSADLYAGFWHSQGGALSLRCALIWSTLMAFNEAQRVLARGSGDPDDVSQLAAGLADHAAISAVTPVAGHPLIAKYLPWAIDVGIDRPDRDEAWGDLAAIDRVSSMTTPALHIGGWYDLFISQTLRSYAQMKAHAGSPEARGGQRLVIGPWSHDPSGWLGFFPDRNFGATAGMEAAMLTDPQIAFFDRWLKGREDALDGHAPVRLFVMGIDQWRDEREWPLSDTSYTAYYLQGDGPANTAAGAGRLTTTEATTVVADTYLYDPRRPVPTIGGTVLNRGGYGGAADQRPLHDRDDILVFTTETLASPLEVTGPVTATLYVSSSAVDTDFTAKLVDVHPDGRAIILCEGLQRMRYRNSLSAPEPMIPEEIYEITIDLTPTANVFLPGHRLVLEISSSNFPQYDRNSNTGGVIAREHLSEMIVAVNHLHRGAGYPSHITLPVINR